MYKNIFDSHAHYTDKAFDSDRDNMLGSLEESGICGVVCCGADLKSSADALALAKKYKYIFATCGIHPEDVDDLPENYIESLTVMAKNTKCVAIGEIGLDYYWRKDNKELQKKSFEEQLQLANKLGLPVIVHDREAHADTLNILKEHRPKGVVHCFSGSAEMAKEILSLDMYIGLGGALTFKNARKALEVAQMLPLNRLLLETDCPYMAPVPMRGKRNNSSYIPFVAEKIAEIKNIDAQTVLDIAAENARTLFNV